jgi:hypothetical protein
MIITIDTASPALWLCLSIVFIVFAVGGYGIHLYNRGRLEGYRTHVYILIMNACLLVSVLEFMR